MCGIWLKKKRSWEKKRELLLIVRWCWDTGCLVKQKSDGRGYPHGIRWHGWHRNPRPVGTVLNLVGTSNFKAINFKRGGKTITKNTLAHFFSLLRSYFFEKTWLGQIPTVPHKFRQACIGSRSLLARLVVILLLCQGSFFFMLCTSHAHFVMWAWHLAVLSGVYPSPSRSELHNSGPWECWKIWRGK